MDIDMDKRPIGFFDSGVGGLSVLRHAIAEMPNEDFIFYGDNSNIPYGEKTPEQIRKLTMENCDILYKMGVKAMLVACNTATSAAIREMREFYRIPVISMEPAIKPACESLEPGRVVVLATPTTIASKRYARLVERLKCAARLINIPCDGFADMLEAGEFDKPEIRAYLEGKLEPLRGEQVSGIVIGCTHYSFVTETITAVANERFTGACEIFDGMYGTVKHLKDTVRKLGLANDGAGGNVEIYSSGGASQVGIMERILKG